MKGKWKQNSKKKKGNAVLQKYMVAVDEFVKSKSGTEEVESDRGLRFVKKKSRKELRKEKRKMKKAKMKSHYEGKNTLSLPLDDGENSGIPAEKQQQQKKKKMEKTKKEVSKQLSSKSSSPSTEKSDNFKTPSPSKKGKKINKLQESRKKALLEANEDEDREIKKLERCLGLNKRKNKKSLPQSFVADGLDYILGMLDSGSSAAGMYDDDDDMDMAKENFEKLDENDSQPSDEDEEPEMESEDSDEDMGSGDDENELDEDDDDDDEMVDDQEEAEEDMEDELDESDAADLDDENEGEVEEEADTPDTKTLGSKSETVSSEIFYYHHTINILYTV